MKPDVLETLPLVDPDGTRRYVHASPDVVTPPTVRGKAHAGLNHGMPHAWTQECHSEGCWPIFAPFNWMPPLNLDMFSVSARIGDTITVPKPSRFLTIDWGEPPSTAQLARAYDIAGKRGVKISTLAELLEITPLTPAKPYPPLPPKPYPRPARAPRLNGLMKRKL